MEAYQDIFVTLELIQRWKEDRLGQDLDMPMLRGVCKDHKLLH